MTNRVAFDDNLFLLPEKQRQNVVDESLFSLAAITSVRNKEEPLQVLAETNAKSKRWRREAQAAGGTVIARISEKGDRYSATTPLRPKPSLLLPVKKRRRRFSFSLYKDEILAHSRRHENLQQRADQKAGPQMGATHEILAKKPRGRRQGKSSVRNARKAITPGKPTAIDAATSKQGDPFGHVMSAFCSNMNQPSVTSPCVSAMADPTAAPHLASRDVRSVKSTDGLKFSGLQGPCLRQPPSATARSLPLGSTMISAPDPPFLVSPAPAPSPLLPLPSASSVAPVLQNASLHESIVASCASRELLEREQREHPGAIMPAVVRSNNDMRNCNGSHPRAARTMGPALLSHDHNQQHHGETTQVLSIHQRAVLCVLLELQGAQTLNNNASTALLYATNGRAHSGERSFNIS